VNVVISLTPPLPAAASIIPAVGAIGLALPTSAVLLYPLYPPPYDYASLYPLYPPYPPPYRSLVCCATALCPRFLIKRGGTGGTNASNAHHTVIFPYPPRGVQGRYKGVQPSNHHPHNRPRRVLCCA
jgi:hypothetical protein